MQFAETISAAIEQIFLVKILTAEWRLLSQIVWILMSVGKWDISYPLYKGRSF